MLGSAVAKYGVRQQKEPGFLTHRKRSGVAQDAFAVRVGKLRDNSNTQLHTMAGGTLAWSAPPVLFVVTPMVLLPAAETDACPTDAGY